MQYRIKPAARLITTIGEDLIGDSYAAILELVKNSYDADADNANITFQYSEDQKTLFIEILDDGHGMTQEDVLTKWLIPATDNKLKSKISPKGRFYQGRKGIGRYAAAILGQELTLSSLDQNGIETTVYVDWQLFVKEEFLEDVVIDVSSKEVQGAPFTRLLIKASGGKLEQWGRSELASLTRELRKLKSPLSLGNRDDIKINLAFINCPFEEYNEQIFEIESFPISELFDYRISGCVDESGHVDATYENNYEENLPSDKLSFSVKLKDGQEYCGPIKFDFRVFDRDPAAISNLIDKGLIDPISKLAASKREAKAQLDKAYGVNLYREDFRIRPYGNEGIDWLDLDSRRIQNPSLRVSNNQVIGFIEIKPEEISNLREKSARDGLKEDNYYFGLVSVLKSVLAELEERRFEYRKKTGKGRKQDSTKKELEQLFDFDSLTKLVSTKLNSLNVEDSTITEIAKLIKREAENKSVVLNNIQKTIAIYQGQATLGKVVTVLLHEGRKPVSYFKQQSPNLARWLIHYKAKRDWDDDIYDDILDRLNNFKEQSSFLSALFKRLDPLSKQNRGDQIVFSIKKAIEKAIQIFENSLPESNIELELICKDDTTIKSWEEDCIVIFSNLIENSIYWLNEEQDKINKKITILVEEDEDNIIMHYKDNGPGISKSNISSGAIFDPGFSKKLNGSGLGLPICGEAAERLGGIILAHEYDDGAYFTVEIKKKNG